VIVEPQHFLGSHGLCLLRGYGWISEALLTECMYVAVQNGTTICMTHGEQFILMLFFEKEKAVT